MGYIQIQVGGSFDNSVSGTKTFGAETHGHADAVARAIEYLAATVLPAATGLDHDLQEDGAFPREGFHRRDS